MILELAALHKKRFRPGRIALALAAFLALTISFDTARAQQETNNNDTMRRQYMLAEGLFERKFHDLAEEEFKNFIAAYPQSGLALRAHFRLAECLNAQDRLDKALTVIETVEKQWPKESLTQRLLLLKANILHRSDNTDKAIETYRRIIGNPDSRLQETARYFLARLLEETGEGNVAETLYGTLAEKDFDPTHPYRAYAVYALAASAQRQGRLERANELYDRLIKHENVPTKLREEALYRYAENAFTQGQYRSALAVYDRIVVDFSGGDFSEEAMKRRIWCHYSIGDYKKAIELGQEWHRLHPDADDVDMNFVMGASLVGASLFEQAVEWLGRVQNSVQTPDNLLRVAGYQLIYCQLRLDQNDTVVELAPAFVDKHASSDEAVDVHYFWATALFRKELFGEAADRLKTALDRFIGDWQYEKDARILLARSLEKIDRHAEAAKILAALAETAPPKQQAIFRIQAGDAARKADEWETAIANYRQALLSGTLSTAETRVAIAHMAQIYTEKDRLSEAVTTFADMLPRMTPENRPQIQLLLGYLYIELEQLDQAQETLAGLTQANVPPEIAGEARYFLADTLLQKGETDTAVALFSELLALPTSERPDFSSELLFQLQELYFNRTQYNVSEKICRWLMDDPTPAVRSKATLRLTEILIASQRYDEAEKALNALLQSSTADDTTPKTELLDATILMGDVYLKRGELDRAATTFQSALAKPGLSMRYATKGRLALAQLLKKEGRLNQSLRHAVNAFVLGNDPVYTPQAMMLAIEILAETGRMKEAATTWRELEARFPIFAAENRAKPVVQSLKTTTP